MYKKVIAVVLAASIGLGSGSASAMLPNGGFGFPGSNGGSGGPGTPFFSRENENINLNLPIQNIDLEAPDSMDAAEFMEQFFENALLVNSINKDIRNGCHGLPLTEALIRFVRNEILTMVRPLGNVRYEKISRFTSLDYNKSDERLFFREFQDECAPAELRICALICSVRKILQVISDFSYLEKNLNNKSDLEQSTNEVLAKWLRKKPDEMIVSFVRRCRDIINADVPFLRDFRENVFDELNFDIVDYIIDLNNAYRECSEQ